MGVPSLNSEVGEVSFGCILMGGGGGCLDGWLKRVARSGFLARAAVLSWSTSTMENYHAYNLIVHCSFQCIYTCLVLNFIQI